MRLTQILVPFSLLVIATPAVRAQLDEVPSEVRAGELTLVSGSYRSTCFTGTLANEIEGTSIRIVFEDHCAPTNAVQRATHTFYRYLPPLSAGRYTVGLRRKFPTEGGTAVEPVGEDRVLTVTAARFRLTITPENPTLGQEVFLDVASQCVHDGFELAPASGRLQRVRWFPTPILPPPCDSEPIHVTRFSLGELPLGAHAVLLTDDGSIRTIVGSLAFEVQQPVTPTLAVQGDRFRVTASWATPAGASGEALAAPLTTDSGAFWFFRPDNLELLFKVLNGCAVNGHFWVLGAGLTDVGVEIEIEDTQTGAIWTHDNPLGQAFEPVQDTGAFDCP